MFCKYCGAILEDETQYCTKCGKTVAASVTEPLSYDKKQTSDNKKGNKILRGFLSVVVCIFLFVFVFASLMISAVRISLQKSNVESVLNDIEVKQVVSANNYIRGVIYELVADEQRIEDVYSKTTIKKHLVSTLLQYTDYVLGGDVPDGISGKYVTGVLRENSEKIESITGIKINEAGYLVTEKIFDIKVSPSIGILAKGRTENDILKIARVICSIYFLVMLYIISVLLFVLLIVVRNKRIDSFIWSGITMLASAAVFTAITTIRPLTMLVVPLKSGFVRDVAEKFFDKSACCFLAVGGAVIVASLLMIIVAVVVKRIKQFSDNK